MDDRSAYDEKLQRILRESSAVFADKGYHNASIRDISSATGISLSGLYYYFKSKEELLFLIQSHCFATIVERVKLDVLEVEDPAERLRLLVRNHLEFFAANMAEMKVLSHEGETLGGEFGARLLSQKKAYSEVFSETLHELAPGRSQPELRTATFSLFGMMNWIYTWYRPDRDLPVEALAGHMSTLFLDGFLKAPTAPRTAGTTLEGPDPERSIWRAPGRLAREG